MRPLNALAFVGAGILLALLRFIIIDELMPYYTIGIAAVSAVYLFVLSRRRRWGMTEHEIDERTVEAFRSAQQLIVARREVRARVPKNAPRRESKVAADGESRLTAARSMASLIRKARLRETVLDICDCAEFVLETIRRMPTDTPAAVAFCETHLAKLTEALEKCFELSRVESYKHAPASIDRQEIECFAAFIFAFRRQQDSILFEGTVAKRAGAAGTTHSA